MSSRLFVDDPADVRVAADALAAGAVVAAAFGNFYVIVTRPDSATVRAVNLAKGRPVDQVGSITTAAPRIPGMYDWAGLSPLLPPAATRTLMDTLYARGPFGFRGPAVDAVPDHLTQWDRGVRTTQVIAPGAACPVNAFFDLAVERLGTDILYITSCNRSRHQTGAVEEPAHWTASGIVADFAHLDDLVVLEHRDEAAARARYPAYAPTSVTLLSFHAPSVRHDGWPLLTVDRHGSLPVDEVRRIAEPLGFAVELGPTAARRLAVREYAGVYA